MSEDRVIVERDGAVAHVKLNRADKRNGLDLAMFEAIIAAGEALADDNAVRAVVLSGEGKAFCAGLDFKSMMASPDMAKRLLHRPEGKPANLAQQVAWVWREVPVPVIAAVHGQAFGGGLQIALGADLRYVRPDAQLSVMEIRWGLIPDMGISKTLPPLVGVDVARELAWTGRVVSGEEAVALGLCTRASEDPLADALETARTIASKNPHAIRGSKRMFDEAPRLDAAAALKLETEIQIPILGSANQMEAVAANFAKRAPEFVDPE